MENEVTQEGLSSTEKENIAGKVEESLGMGGEENSDNSESSESEEKEDLPRVAKERLGRQEKRHRKEMRAMQEQIAQLHSKLTSSVQSNSTDADENPYYQQNNSGTEDDRIQRAIVAALRHKDMEEQKAKHAEQMARVQKHYKDLQDDIDSGADKYDDFDDVVRAPDASFTDAMRDASLLIPKHLRADVLYKLGKNREELQRISKLHPLDQAQEVIKLGFALHSGDGKSSSNAGQSGKILNSVKSNPQTSNSAVSSRSTASEIRARMKSGNWR